MLRNCSGAAVLIRRTVWVQRLVVHATNIHTPTASLNNPRKGWSPRGEKISKLLREIDKYVERAPVTSDEATSSGDEHSVTLRRHSRKSGDQISGYMNADSGGTLAGDAQEFGKEARGGHGAFSDDQYEPEVMDNPYKTQTALDQNETSENTILLTEDYSGALVTRDRPRRGRGTQLLDDARKTTPSREDWERESAQQLLRTSRADVSGDFRVEYPSDVTDHEEFFRGPAFDPSMHKYKNRPKVEPRDTSVILFPGQGSQFVGMGQELLKYPNVAEMYNTASEILGYDLLKLCLHGPKSELDKTIYCQPAVLVTSLAAIEKLRHEDPLGLERCVSTAGFSVGEYSSLVFAGALSFEDAVHLIDVRGRAMQKASEAVNGGMMTVMTGASTQLSDACAAAKQYMKERIGIEVPICNVASFLFTCGKVLAGHTEGLYFIEKVYHEFNIKRVKQLPVSGAFHTLLMLPARDPLRRALASTRLQRPVIWCYSNVTGHRHSDRPDAIRRKLEKQLTNQVRWEQTVCNIFDRSQGDNFPTTYECGPGNQLLTMLRLTNGKAFKRSKRVTV